VRPQVDEESVLTCAEVWASAVHATLWVGIYQLVSRFWEWRYRRWRWQLMTLWTSLECAELADFVGHLELGIPQLIFSVATGFAAGTMFRGGRY
jgi:hypothetical protein